MAEPRQPADVVDELRSIVAANVAGSVDLVARVNGVVRKALAEAPSSPPPDAADVLARLLDASLSSYAEVNRHALALLNGLVSVAERALLPAPPAAPPTHVDVRLDGRVGDRVPCPFLVENQYDQPVDVTFRARPFTAPGQDDVPESVVDFEPRRLRVPARSSAVATAVVTVGQAFVPGATYIGTVKVVGFEGREVGIALAVMDAGDPPAVAQLVPRAAPAATSRARPPRRRAGGVAAR